MQWTIAIRNGDNKTYSVCLAGQDEALVHAPRAHRGHTLRNSVDMFSVEGMQVR